MGEHKTFFAKAIDASEMACSLIYEDVKGCPYHAFTPRSIAALSISSSILALLSLFVAI